MTPSTLGPALDASRNRPVPFHLLAKPTGAICNLDCKYCFFLSKEMLYPGSRFEMADGLLDTYIRQLLVTSEQQHQFGLAKRDTLPKYCRECKVRFACHGECPKNRFITMPDGEPGLNYLCAGYKAFFTHIDPAMRLMADLLRRGRYADEAMAILEARRI